jgi:hypothetical protein
MTKKGSANKKKCKISISINKEYDAKRRARELMACLREFCVDMEVEPSELKFTIEELN